MRTSGIKKMGKLIFLFSIFYFSVFASSAFSSEKVRGFWVECEGSNSTLSSPEKLLEMIKTVKDSGGDTIFLQVYRHNRSWYDSSLADTTPYDIINAKCKIDPLKFAIEEAHQKGLKVHAWINTLRIGKDLKAPVIRDLGKEIITRDGRGVSLIKYKEAKLPDGGYWLDPGDPAVKEYVLKVVKELLQKYPDLDGIHLDYVRYPYTDINPGCRFSNKKDLGYGVASVQRFKLKYGYSPLSMDLSDKNATQQWDDWRREQITEIVQSVSKLCKNLNPKLQISCAVQPWIDRAYMTAYQDWREWEKSGIVDFVVLMNYSVDTKIVGYLSEAAVKMNGSSAPSYIGLGAYMHLKSPYKLYQQIENCQKINAKGIVLFSYDAILQNKEIFKEISKSNWWETKS